MRVDHIESESSTKDFPTLGPAPSVAEFSPPVQITALAIPRGHVHVVRDDLLPGGTKQRAAVPYLQDLQREGYRELVYASPFAGFAQVALAASALQLGMTCRLYCEEDRSRSEFRGAAHAFTRLAESMGARVVITSTLEAAEQLAAAHVQERGGAVKVPLGFNAPSFIRHLSAEIRTQWQLVLHHVGAVPQTLWLPVGSGTLANAFRDTVDDRTFIQAVDVRVLDRADARLQALALRSGVRLAAAPEPFMAAAELPPPIPSNAHYDAKLWAFVQAHGADGDVWWNVAR
jgi:1-aminocyclopropane-1-carboxylate deaminase/D-cysteine desulfhydrase-like pyridoxal-dependent ACC family enzyme